MIEPTDCEKAWISGLFDGEGHISLRRRGASLALSMSDEDVILRLQSVTGIGSVKKYGPYPTAPTKLPSFRWTVSNYADVQTVLTWMLPWLGDRRTAVALEALQRIKEATVVPHYKLSESQVREIELRDESQRILGREYGVSHNLIYRIRKNKKERESNINTSIIARKKPNKPEASGEQFKRL